MREGDAVLVVATKEEMWNRNCYNASDPRSLGQGNISIIYNINFFEDVLLKHNRDVAGTLMRKEFFKILKAR